VTGVAEYLVVFQVVGLQWVFELCAKYNMIHVYLAFMECAPTSCTYRAISQEYLFPDIHASLPSFLSGPDGFVLRIDIL
jgi:hypothetical protein